MENYDITLKWSTLLALTTDEVNKFNGNTIEGVYRISRKDIDGKFYVVFVGSGIDLKKELLALISQESGFLKQGGDFAFRYAPVKGKEAREAIEKQMYKQYVPRYNTKEPVSPLEIRVNLN